MNFMIGVDGITDVSLMVDKERVTDNGSRQAARSFIAKQKMSVRCESGNYES